MEKIFPTEIYPQKAIEQMKKENYNPIMIGSRHEMRDLDQEKNILLKLKKEIPKDQITIAYEILPPIQLQYIIDFLEFENEYFKNHSEESESWQWRVASFKDYRRRLSSNHAENFALWLLEHQFRAIPLEHENALDWSKEIDNDKELYERIASEQGFSEAEKILCFYKDIKRDIHNLERINEKRPDIVSVGCAHAVKYDYLMGRDGARSIYVPEDARDDLVRFKDLLRAAHHYYVMFKRKF